MRRQKSKRLVGNVIVTRTGSQKPLRGLLHALDAMGVTVVVDANKDSERQVFTPMRRVIEVTEDIG